jgi:hypothetical protein
MAAALEADGVSLNLAAHAERIEERGGLVAVTLADGTTPAIAAIAGVRLPLIAIPHPHVYGPTRASTYRPSPFVRRPHTTSTPTTAATVAVWAPTITTCAGPDRAITEAGRPTVVGALFDDAVSTARELCVSHAASHAHLGP